MGRGSGGGGRSSGGGAAVAEAPTEKTIEGDGSHKANGISAKEYAAQLGISEAEAKARYKAVKDFTQFGYTEIRNAEMQGIKDPRIDKINAYLKSVPAFKGEIHRGLNFKSKEEFETFQSSLKRGGIKLNAMSSFSSDKGTALGYASKGHSESVRVLLTVSGNKSAKSVRSRSAWKNEDEVLAPKGTRYRLVGQTETSYFGLPAIQYHLQEY